MYQKFAHLQIFRENRKRRVGEYLRGAVAKLRRGNAPRIVARVVMETQGRILSCGNHQEVGISVTIGEPILANAPSGCPTNDDYGGGAASCRNVKFPKISPIIAHPRSRARLREHDTYARDGHDDTRDIVRHPKT